MLFDGLYEINYSTEGKEIHFFPGFNEKIEYLPDDDINIILFNDDFNNNIDLLPNGITQVFLGNKFDKPVNNLPNGIKFISFGTDFSHPINCLPDSVEQIRLTQHYNQPISKLPKGIKIFDVLQVTKRTYNVIKDWEEQTNIPAPNYYEIYSNLELKYPNVKFFY